MQVSYHLLSCADRLGTTRTRLAKLLWQRQVKRLSHLLVIIPLDFTLFLMVP